jgi:hypothetical protein
MQRKARRRRLAHAKQAEATPRCARAVTRQLDGVVYIDKYHVEPELSGQVLA